MENTYALCFLLVMGLNLTVIVFTAVVVSRDDFVYVRILNFNYYDLKFILDNYKSWRHETNDKINTFIWSIFISSLLQLCSRTKSS